jgi:polar amino acid transport system permease protein
VDVIVPYLPSLLKGTVTTLWLSAATLILALVVGLVVALGRLSRRRVLRTASRVYTDLIRGTPALIQIFYIYFGLPQLGINIDAIPAGIIALGINSGAYMGEIFRAGIQSIDPGQMEAARSVGMSHRQAMQVAILPQVVRRVIPPITGEATSLVKGTSLLSVISIGELTRVGQQIVGVTFRPLEAFAAIGLTYLVINVALSQLSVTLERRLTFPQ